MPTDISTDRLAQVPAETPTTGAWFQGPPTTAQFAKAGSWETAWSFDADQPPTEAAVIAYLGNCTELAFEAFFGPAFFGVRLVGTPAQVQAFAFEGLGALRDSRRSSFFEQMQRRFQLPVKGAAVAFMEVGCVNAWQSIGTVRFDDPKAAATSFDDTWRAVQASPLSRDTRRVKALEYAFEAPLSHWFGVPVCEAEAPFRLSAPALLAALRQRPA
jgi:hypothetical protein